MGYTLSLFQCVVGHFDLVSLVFMFLIWKSVFPPVFSFLFVLVLSNLHLSFIFVLICCIHLLFIVTVISNGTLRSHVYSLHSLDIFCSVDGVVTFPTIVEIYRHTNGRLVVIGQLAPVRLLAPPPLRRWCACCHST